MGRIDRYLLSQLLGAFGLAALTLVMVVWINAAVRVFDQLIADGQSPRVFLELAALVLPSILEEVLPFAGVAATLYAVAKLAGDSEIVVVQATGASPWRLARPVLMFGLIVAALVGVLAHLLVPMSLGRLDARQADIARTATARLLQPGGFVSPQDGVTLYIRETSPEGELQGLLISDQRDPLQAVTVTAVGAFLVQGEAGPQLVMRDGMLQQRGAEDGRLVVTGFSELTYDLAPFLPQDEGGPRAVREVPTAEMLWPTQALAAETGRSLDQLYAEGHDRIGEGLIPPATALIGLGALLLGQFSRFGVWRQVILAVVLVIAVKGAEVAVAPAVRSGPGMWPLTYLPSAIGFLLAAGLLELSARPRRRRWAVAT